jgi:molybdate transport system substrate-binding protein
MHSVLKLASFVLVIALAACSRGAESGAAPAADPAPEGEPVRVLSSNGVKAVVDAVRADVEQAIGRPLDITYSTATSLKAEIEKGAAFDVAILTPAFIRDLTAAGKIAAGSEVDIARTGVGVGARQGAAPADVSTADALKATLLNAKSVAFTEAGQSRATIDATYRKLGIEEAMRAKSVLKGPGEAPEAVAHGEAELVLTLISEILPVTGVQLLGPLPAEVQGYVSFAGGRSTAARDAAAADAVLRYLSGPAVSAALSANGMEAVE